jgi:GT2 family glycosyltransferase
VITKIGVVIVAYDAGELLNLAVDSIQLAATKSKFSINSCVIDNHPEARDSRISSKVDFYHHSETNLGFGGGCNIGIRACLEEFNSEYVLLLNPDARVNKDFFFELEKILEDSEFPIYTPISPMILLDEELKIYNLGKLLDISDKDLVTLVHGHKFLRIYNSEGKLVSNNSNNHVRVKGDFWAALEDLPKSAKLVISETISSEEVIRVVDVKKAEHCPGYLINNAGSYINPPFIAGDVSFQDLYLPQRWNHNEARSVWCGACVLLHRGYIDEVGYFDEDFFLYYEDIELSLRGVKRGLSARFYPKLICFHGHSKSTSRNLAMRNYNIWRSRALFVRKVYGLSFALLFLLKLSKPFIRPNLTRSHLRHIWRNLLPELNATIRGILGLR